MLHRGIAARKQSAAPSDLHAHGRLVERFDVQRAFLVSAARKLAMHSPGEGHPAGALLTRACRSRSAARLPAIAPPPPRRAGVPAQGAGRALVNGAASRLRLRLRSLTHTLPSPAAAFPRSCVRDMFSPCAPTLSHPTPTSSSGSAVDAARERAPIASPVSPPNTARKSR